MGNASVLRQAVAVAVILFARNNHLSAFHHALGQILDQGGATDEVWEINFPFVIRLFVNNLIHAFLFLRF